MLKLESSVAMLLLALVSGAALAAPPGPGRAFTAASPVLEADLGQRSVADAMSIELWLQPAANAPEGAVIVDKLTPVPATASGWRWGTVAGCA